MSIAHLKKLSLAGNIEFKNETLAHLQNLGCMHVISLREDERKPEENQSREAENAYKALHFLNEVSGERRQVKRDNSFDIHTFVNEVLSLRQTLRDVGDRRDFLEDRIAALKVWGDLVFPELDALGGYAFWFYEVPFWDRASLEKISLPWELVTQDHRLLYVAVLSQEEPPEDLLPVPRVHVGSKPRSLLLQELDDVEIELEDLKAERIALTRYLDLFRARMSEAESKAELDYAVQQTLDDDTLFVVQGWVSSDDLEPIYEFADAHSLALVEEEPAWNETPPTLLVQPEKEAAGVDLAMFYQVPNYRGWDPSILLIASFSLFFAMIVADAGYGLVILAGLLLGWKKLDGSSKLKAWRRLGLIISAATILYGVVVGSYFGVAPSKDSILQSFAILDLNDFDVMMQISILIGVAHIVFAIAMNAWVNRSQRSSRAQLGWIAGIVGGLLYWLSGQTGQLATVGLGLFMAGLVAIIFFTSERPIEKSTDWAWRIFDGIKALNGAMGAFGDILSYMRLFALGLASASLAITFNDLAVQVADSVPGLGLLLGALILLVGHILNFGLALMSGVVHGLRLNYIEFFKWGLPEEGAAFRPLTRKEVKG